MAKTTTGKAPVDVDGSAKLATLKTAAYLEGKKMLRNYGSDLEVTNDPISADFEPFRGLAKSPKLPARVGGHRIRAESSSNAWG